MTRNDILYLLPLIVLAASSVLLMFLIALKLSHRFIQLSSMLLFGSAILTLFVPPKELPYYVEPLVVIDDFSIYIMGLIMLSSLVVNILSYIYFEEKEEGPKEYYVLLFLCTLGACVLAVSKHFVSLFLGLEILTVGLYALIAYLRTRNNNIEAGIKYLVLAAFSAAFLLFGMALIYLETGSMEFSVISRNVSQLETLTPVFLTGLGLMMVGIGFKLAVVPFHMWTADVYQGAPSPVTAFIATASKGGVLVVFFRFLIMIDAFRFQSVMVVITYTAIASMVVGNILALQQTNVKRLLAYSSIAHLGYLLVAFLPGSVLSLHAVSFYLTVYIISILCAFGVLTVLSVKEKDAEDIESFRALFWQEPALACVFSAALLSLAGIPLTAGFIGKFFILAGGLEAGYLLTVIVLVLSSVIGLYYYLRIITSMFSGQNIGGFKQKKTHPIFYMLCVFILAALTVLILWFGVYPSTIMDFIEDLQL
ncbi:NADH-quinone oxidoreductase subunit N [Pedobacter sp.]|uniref:NADH-quinone oxidoreductase subunit N n=1 Tax=Pedobacter sp. TaxID=1411316 RepID=UPI003D7F44FD